VRDELRFTVAGDADPSGKQSSHWDLFDALGRRITGGAAREEVRWIPESGGHPLSRGVYYLEVRAGTRTAHRRVLILGPGA
jgi:hypothetical protein